MKKTTTKKKSPVPDAGGTDVDCPPSGADHERIAEAAYYLWEKDGRPQGRDQLHWTRAEAALRNRGSKPARAV